MRARALLVLPALLLTACTSGGSGSSAATVTVTAAPSTGASSPVASPQAGSATPDPSATATPVAVSGCRTLNLKLRLGKVGASAGSRYEPIIFTNVGTAACTMNGYPYLMFVAPGSGKQVGAVATFNPVVPVKSVLVQPGGVASALLQIANYANFSCPTATVSGLRVYPPNNTGAAYLPFPAHATACSSNVNQLSVGAVVAGTTGM